MDLIKLKPYVHVSDVVFIFQGELNGHRGLVPSNFLQALPEDTQPAPEPKRESQVALLFCLFSRTTAYGCVCNFLTCSHIHYVCHWHQ